MKKIIYGLITLLLSGCSDFLKEYSQTQTVAKEVSHFDEVLLGDGYIPASACEYISTNYAGWLNTLDDDITTVPNGTAGKKWAGMMQPLFGYYAWQLEVGRNPEGNNLRDDSQTWLEFYRRINVVNIILKEIDDISVDSPAEEKDRIRVKGECHFIRGQLFFTLINLYAKAYNEATSTTDPGVPLKLTEYVEHDKDKDIQFERTPVAQVYNQIVKDLQSAVTFLTESPQSRPLHRASRQAALLLLSRVYLYMQDWENARQTAEELLTEQATLSQINTQASAFLTEENPEVLFSQGSLNVQNSIQGEQGDFAVSPELVELFDTTDYRRNFFVPHFTTGALGLSAKYKTGIEFVSHISDIFTLRIAEAYLNMAEACAMLDATEEANRYLQRLRENRIENYRHTAYSGEQLIDEIRLERRRELCFEGHRWFDLRRYAVCKTYPYSKPIRHQFNVYESRNYHWERTDTYVLKENDPAYTFQIPQSVLEYDKVPMPANPREKRQPVGEDDE